MVQATTATIPGSFTKLPGDNLLPLERLLVASGLVPPPARLGRTIFAKPWTVEQSVKRSTTRPASS